MGLAIPSEVTGATFLVQPEGFGKLGPDLLVFVFDVISFYLLLQVLKTIPLGIAYAIRHSLSRNIKKITILHNPVLDYEWSSRGLFSGFCDFKLEYDGYGNTKN